MAYEDLDLAERRAFHRATVAKHRECERHLDAVENALTNDERDAREAKISEIMHTSIRADDYKAPQPVNLSEVPAPADATEPDTQDRAQA